MCPKGAYPLKRFLQYLAFGRESRVRTLIPNFTVLALKMWAYSHKIAKNRNFWYKFAQKGYTPLSDFYKIWLWGVSPRSAPSYQISPFSLLKCGPTASKIAIFRINLLLRENSGGPQKKLNIGAQLQTFLYAMTP